jgi:hypothetical protein
MGILSFVIGLVSVLLVFGLLWTLGWIGINYFRMKKYGDHFVETIVTGGTVALILVLVSVVVMLITAMGNMIMVSINDK